MTSWQQLDELRANSIRPPQQKNAKGTQALVGGVVGHFLCAARRGSRAIFESGLGAAAANVRLAAHWSPSVKLAAHSPLSTARQLHSQQTLRSVLGGAKLGSIVHDFVYKLTCRST